MTRQRRPGRCGFTLIEVLVYCTLTAAIFSLSVALMHVAYRAQRRTERWATAIQQRARLAQDLASDVHAAEDIRLFSAAETDPAQTDPAQTDPAQTDPAQVTPEQPDGAQRLELTLTGGRSVEYAWDVPWITRTESEGGAVKRREAYLVESHEAPRWHVDPRGREVTLQLAIAEHQDSSRWHRIVSSRRRHALVPQEEEP